jgi:IS5 family transposase
MYISDDKQQNFFEDALLLWPNLDKEHFLIKLADNINWDNITNKLSKFYCLDNGRPSKPTRAMIGLLLVQRYYKLSDRETTQLLQENIYVQYFCNISIVQAKQFIDPSFQIIQKCNHNCYPQN